MEVADGVGREHVGNHAVAVEDHGRGAVADHLMQPPGLLSSPSTRAHSWCGNTRFTMPLWPAGVLPTAAPERQKAIAGSVEGSWEAGGAGLAAEARGEFSVPSSSMPTAPAEEAEADADAEGLSRICLRRRRNSCFSSTSVVPAAAPR